MRVLFTQKITVYRLQDSSDKESYAEYSTIKGYIAPISAEDSMLTDGNPANTYKLVCDHNQDIKKTDKLVYNDDSYIVSGVQSFGFGATRRKAAILNKFNS